MLINAKNISISDYWREVRRIQRDLPDTVVLASIPAFAPGANQDDRDRGVVQFVECNSLTAAKLLFDGTHRLATAEECGQQGIKRISDIRSNVARHLAAQGIVAIQLPSSSE